MDRKPRRPLVAQRADLEDFNDVQPAPPAPEPAPSSGPAPSPDGSPPAADVSTAACSFTGKRRELFRIALVNALLTILTLGIYRFWAKTRLRRYFWSNIRVDNEPLEYTGTAIELLIGFLVVLAILVPIFALYQGALFVAGSAPEWVTISLNIVYGFALLAFFQYAFYRMWRYRFSRTNWRGIRFGQSGSAWKYVGITLLWMLVSALTLGMAFPWLRNAQWKYRISNLHFGKTAATYTGRTRPMFRKWLIASLLPTSLTVLAFILYFESVIEFYQQAQLGSDQDHERVRDLLGQLVPFYALLAGASFYGFFAIIWYRVHEANYVLGQVHMGTTAFTSDQKPGALVALFVVNLVCIGLVVVAPVGLVIFITSNGVVLSSTAYAGLGVAAFLIVLTVPSIISTIILNHGIARHVCAHIKILNPDGLQEMRLPAGHKPEFGEGLADALDVGAL